MRRLNAHAAELYATEAPVVLAGDYNVVPQTSTSIRRSPGIATRCCGPKAAPPIRVFSRWPGPTPFARSIPSGRGTRFGVIFGGIGSAGGLDHIQLSSALRSAWKAPAGDYLRPTTPLLNARLSRCLT